MQKALTWVSADDEAQVPIDELERFLVQQYVFTVMSSEHYSGCSQTWTGQYEFLTEGHECDWSGVLERDKKRSH